MYLQQTIDIRSYNKIKNNLKTLNSPLHSKDRRVFFIIQSMKKTLISLGFVIILFSSCTIKDTTVTVQGHATLLPWGTPINNGLVILQDEYSLHKGVYYDRVETRTDPTGFYKLSHTFNHNASLVLGFIQPNVIETRNAAIQLTKQNQTINFNCYCNALGAILVNDSSQLTTKPDSIIFINTNIIKNYKIKIDTNFFNNPDTLYIKQIAGYPNTISCKIYRNGVPTLTNTIINPNACNQTTQLNFNY